MMVWKYTIQTDAGIIITANTEYAEKKVSWEISFFVNGRTTSTSLTNKD